MRILVGLLIFFVAFQIEAKESFDLVAYKQRRFQNACVTAANDISTHLKGGIALNHQGESTTFCQKQADMIPRTDWQAMDHTSERGCLTAFANMMPKNLPQDKVAKVADQTCRFAVATDMRMNQQDEQLMAQGR